MFAVLRFSAGSVHVQGQQSRNQKAFTTEAESDREKKQKIAREIREVREMKIELPFQR